MTTRDITEKERHAYNTVVSHPLQSYEWGEFRKATGIRVVRRGFFDENDKLTEGFQLTIHPIPRTSWTIGYLPKGNLPSKELLAELQKIGKEHNCIFIQLEPNLITNYELPITNEENTEDASTFESIIRNSSFAIRPSAHPLFTKYTFILDISKSEEELLAAMHHKTRYNIRVAQKHEVTVQEENTDEAFKEYLRLTEETTNRQGFYAHTRKYHQTLWQELGIKNQELGIKENKNHNSSFAIHNSNNLTAHLFTAKYQEKTLVAWMLFVFKDHLYYPYGASSSEHREVMASNLMMWEAIRYGKKVGLKTFDMWGALGTNPDTKDPWYGFHRFKEGYGAQLTEFVGSYDLVINPLLYQGYKVADRLRWMYLRLKK